MTPLVQSAAVTALSLALTLCVLALLAATRLRSRANSDEMTRRLDALTDRLTLLETREPEPPAEIRSTPAPSPALPNATRRVDRPVPKVSDGPTLIAVPNLASNGDPSDETSDELTRRFGAILEMAEAGASAESIARATGQPVGQVELILGIKRQLESSHSGGVRAS